MAAGQHRTLKRSNCKAIAVGCHLFFYLQIPLITAKRPWVPGLDPGPGPGGKSPRPTEGGTPAGRNSLRPLATDYVKERRMEFIHPAGNGHAIVPVTAILQERPWAHRLNAETRVRRR